MRELENLAAIMELAGGTTAQAFARELGPDVSAARRSCTAGCAAKHGQTGASVVKPTRNGVQLPLVCAHRQAPHSARHAAPACCGLAPRWERRTSIRGSHRAQVPVGRRFPSVPAGHSGKAPTERFRWPFATRTPDGIRTRYRLERANPAQRIRAGQRRYGLVRSRVWGTHGARLELRM